MKIKTVEYIRLDMPLSEPYTIAYETVSSTSNIILKVTTDSGLTGWGCAAPDKEVTGETPEAVIQSITEIIEPGLIGESPFQVAWFNHEFRQLKKIGRSAQCMLDMALLDLTARKAHIPLYQLLGGFRKKIETSITIGILSKEETLERARDFLAQGFSILKLKGGLSLEEDVEKVRKLREAFGNHFRLRFDANQGYSPEEAIRFTNDTKLYGIEMLEQPTRMQSEADLKTVTQNISVPVMADESIKTLKDAFRLTSNETIDMVNIKIMKVGGISEAQHINSVAKAGGMEVMVGCLDECALGIGAGLHFALSRPNIEFADLDGHLDLLDDPFEHLFELKNGWLYPSDYPGLGPVNL